MGGLFKKIMKGQYPQIPTHFSMDMRTLIKSMLQVQPNLRPNTSELLSMTIVQKRMRKYFSDQDGKLLDIMRDSQKPMDDLFATIKPRANLFKIVLPDEKYALQDQKFNLGGNKGIFEKSEKETVTINRARRVDEMKLNLTVNETEVVTDVYEQYVNGKVSSTVKGQQ